MSEEDTAQAVAEQPPFFIQISRPSVASINLSNALTGEVLYKVRDTGRGSFSSKPDFEVFRCAGSSSGELFIGGIRLNKSSTEVKFAGRKDKITDVEKFTASHQAEDKGKQLSWNVTKSSRSGTHDRSVGVPDPVKLAQVHEIVVIECSETGQESEPICIVKLYDTIPNGRIEVWTKGACVDVGGSWDALDELVVLAYANQEKARRKLMKGIDQGSFDAFSMSGGAAFG